MSIIIYCLAIKSIEVFECLFYNERNLSSSFKKYDITYARKNNIPD